MANFYYTSDLKKGALQRCGEVTNGRSSYEALALKYLNQTYFSILAGGNEFDVDMGEPWVWAKSASPVLLELKAPYSTGTITVTNASTTATLSSSPAVGLGSFAGYFLKVGERAEYFKISAHTAGSASLTLDQAYIDTSGSALSYSLTKLTYGLGASVLRLHEPMRVYQNQEFGENDGKIYGIEEAEFYLNFPLKTLKSGVPTRFYKSFDSTMSPQVTFNAAVASPCRVEVDYIAIPTELTDDDSVLPLIPREHRIVLEYGATYFMMLDKDDQRSQTYLALLQSKLKSMVEANRREITLISKNKGKIMPRQDQFTRIDELVIRT